ncbi:MAG: prephenate dehydratase [Eubacterium sp.]|nr:prephenate dehydratase [Eubacterium sp.]
MDELIRLRDEIDVTDKEIVRLFEKRMRLVEDVAQYKIRTGKKVLDPGREADKLAALGERASTDFNKTCVQEVFRQMMAISRKRQYQILLEHGLQSSPEYTQCDAFDYTGARVVFQGVEGAYSFAAMKAFFDPSIESSHVATWREAFEMVVDGRADYAVLPIENSTAGSVSDIYDLMINYPVSNIGEQIIPIDHVLMGVPGTDLQQIRKVYSHPQALAQCRKFLEQHPEWQTEPLLNTAIAAKKVAEDGDPAMAAIASRTAAEYFGLQILESEGLSEQHNQTRFIIISGKNCFRKDAQHISICFELPHKIGTLYIILSHFIFNDLNMTRIESRPIPERGWEYRFFVDFDGNLEDSGVQNALTGIKAETADLRLLGNY